MPIFSSSIKPSPVGIAIIVFILVGVVYLYIRGPAHEASHPKGKVLISHVLSAALDLAERGGQAVAKVRLEQNVEEKVKAVTKEGKAEFVTKGDVTSHRAILKGLIKAFPDINYISEEHEEERELDVVVPNMLHEEILSIANKGTDAVPISDVSVWIDPLDATQEYTENLLQYVTVMICIAVGEKPVAAVIREPNFGGDKPGKTSWAWVGHGASEGLENIAKATKEQGKKRSVSDGMKIVVSRSHAGSVDAAAKKALGEKTETVPAGGAGYKVLQVVGGKADAYVHVTCIKKWDICAGDAILRAFGGKMTTLTGNSVSYLASDGPYNDGGILAALANHDDLKDKFKEMVDEGKIKVAPCKH
eukprot:m.310536 g.310536  ORF g.310536 m.310536 type:complete len:361 (+) comp52346_c0_seq1:24-1106(+)